MQQNYRIKTPMSITILDGSIGQELVTRAPENPTGLWSTKVMLDHPELVRQEHDGYFAVGAEIATTNTYAVHRDRLINDDIEDQFERLQQIGCQLAVDARDAHGAGRVAGAMGPTICSYRPDLSLPADEAAECYAEIAKIQVPYVDLFLLETLASVDMVKGGLMGATTQNKPVWLGVSVDDKDGTKLRSGEAVTDILPLIEQYKPEALLINCSVPEAVTQAIPLLAGKDTPIGAYANGFQRITEAFAKPGTAVDLLDARKDLDPNTYANFAQQWITDGATIIGGCCEVGPAHIKEMVVRFKR